MSSNRIPHVGRRKSTKSLKIANPVQVGAYNKTKTNLTVIFVDFELRSKSTGVCIHTHYKEVLKCANGETVTRSCDRAAFYDEQMFWRFEGCMFVASIFSTLCVISRKKVLNKRMLQRVQRQLANCV